MRRTLLATCFLLAAAGGIGGSLGSSGSSVAHAAKPPCSSKTSLCYLAQSDGNTWWLVIIGHGLQTGSLVSYSYSAPAGGGAGAVAVSAKNGSLNYQVQGGVCPANQVTGSAIGTTSSGAPASATVNGFPC